MTPEQKKLVVDCLIEVSPQMSRAVYKRLMAASLRRDCWLCDRLVPGEGRRIERRAAELEEEADVLVDAVKSRVEEIVGARMKGDADA